VFDYSNPFRRTTRHLREALRSLLGFLDRQARRSKRGRFGDDATTNYLNAALTEPSWSSRQRKTPQQNEPGQIPVRVIAVSHNLNIEGAPLAQLELMLALAQSGIIVPTIVSPHDGYLRQEYESAGISVRIVPAVEFTSAQTFTQSLLSVQNIFEDCGADVVYANTLVTFWAIVAAKSMGLPSLWNIREVDPAAAYFDHLPESVCKKAYKCFRHPYRVIFVSDAGVNMSSRFESRDNFDIIYDALDAERMEKRNPVVDRSAARAELGIADSELGILALGTIHEGKGQLDLIEAIGQMPEHSSSKVRVYVVGNGGHPYSKHLIKAMEELPSHLASRIQIRLTDYRSHIYHSAADIAVCCSRRDSYPRVVLEAMFFGLPLITTLTCGCELVHENANALVYPAGESRMLASCLTKLVTDTELRQKLASNSKKIFGKLPSFDGMVRQYGEIFNEAKSYMKR
jgi:O-antigen biosynthesis protein